MSVQPGYASPEAQKEMQERGMFDHSQHQQHQQHMMPQQAHMQQGQPMQQGGHPQQYMQHQGSFNHQQGFDPMVQQMQQQGAFYQNAMLADCARGNHSFETKYGIVGIIVAVLCCPCGLLALLCDQHKKCSRCGTLQL